MENQNQNQNPFESYVGKKAFAQKTNKLSPGKYLVTITDHIIFTTDKMTVQGEDNENIELYRNWMDENPVLYLYLVHPDGVFHQRFYWYGYVLFEELSKNNLNPADFHCTTVQKGRPYAIHNESSSRVIDDKKTLYCKQLLDEFMTAAKCNSKPIQELAGRKIWIEVKEQIAFGKKHLKIARFASEEEGFETNVKFAEPKNTGDVKPLF